MERRAQLSLLAAVALPIAVAAALVPVREEASSANLALVLVVVVVCVAVAGTRTAAATCAVMTALAYDFFLTQPYQSLTIEEPDEVITTVLLLAVGVTVGALSHWARSQRSRAHEREEDVGLLYQVIEQIAAGADDQTIIALGEREIAHELGAVACRYETFDDEPDDSELPLPLIDHIGNVYIGDVLWPTDEVGLPNGETAIEMQSGGMPMGRFVVESNDVEPMPRWRLLMSVMVANVIGSALARWPAAS